MVRTIQCLGSSQWPMIRHGAMVEVVPIPFEALRCGDVLLFRNEGWPTCHRLMKRRGNQALIKGDACWFFDGWIDKQAVIGKVIKINGSRVDHGGLRVLSQALYWYSYVTGAGIFWAGRFFNKSFGWASRRQASW